MASEKEHIEIANSNQKLIDHLIAQNSFHDWLAIVAFYKAIHVVEAVFANSHFHSSSHVNREERLTSSTHFKPIFKDYEHLSNESKSFRYLLNSPNCWNIETVKMKLIYKRLYGVEQNSLQFLSDEGRNALVKITPPRQH